MNKHFKVNTPKLLANISQTATKIGHPSFSWCDFCAGSVAVQVLAPDKWVPVMALTNFVPSTCH